MLRPIILFFVFAFFATTAFIVSDPTPDFIVGNPMEMKQIAVESIPTKNSEMHHFKTAMDLKIDRVSSAHKMFFGQAIRISDNPQLDQVCIGVTSNMISRVEIWNKGKLIVAKELGFMSKMTFGETQQMTVEFKSGSSLAGKAGKGITMHFTDGTGFFGDIGTITADLGDYGDLSGPTSFSVFSKPIEGERIDMAEITMLRIWNNFQSFD